MSYKPDKEFLSYCESCERETSHLLILESFQDGSDQNENVTWQNRIDLVQCQGCRDKVFRTVFYFSENFDENGKYIPEIRYYPTISVDKLNALASKNITADISKSISRMFAEVYVAYNGNCLALAATGIRAIIEYTLSEIVASNSKNKPIEEACNLGFISVPTKELLLAIHVQGSASIHREYFPEKALVKLALEEVEDMVRKFCTQEKITEQIKSKTPPRE